MEFKMNHQIWYYNRSDWQFNYFRIFYNKLSVYFGIFIRSTNARELIIITLYVYCLAILKLFSFFTLFAVHSILQQGVTCFDSKVEHDLSLTIKFSTTIDTNITCATTFSEWQNNIMRIPLYVNSLLNSMGHFICFALYIDHGIILNRLKFCPWFFYVLIIM